jgi:hypothetical protein
MVKAIPVMIVLASIVTPLVLSGQSQPKRAVRRLYVIMAAFALIWAILCVSVYPRYVFPE